MNLPGFIENKIKNSRRFIKERRNEKMKPKKLLPLVLTLFLLSSLAGVAAFAGEKKGGFFKPRENPKHMGFPKLRKLLPDLVVSDIRAKEDPKGCFLQVTMKNAGPGAIPDEFYKRQPPRVAIQMYNGNKPWGGTVLFGFDPGKRIQKPGGSVTWDWFPGAKNLRLAPGYHTIKVVADNNKELPEANENNNSLTKRISCFCNEKLPNPEIAFSHRDRHGSIYINVKNWRDFPESLFIRGPDFLSCDMGIGGSRAAYVVRDALTNQDISLLLCIYDQGRLKTIKFHPGPKIKRTRKVYVEMIDRGCKRTLKSNIISIPQTPISWVK